MRAAWALLCLIVTSLGILTCFANSALAATTPKRHLVLLTWSEYIDPKLISEFEAKYKTKITQVFFESDDMRQDMLLETDGIGYDVILVSGISVDAYRKRGWLAPLNETEIPNLKHIYPKWLTAFAGTKGYAVPYFWGTLGIAYRKDLAPAPITSWKQLYEPAEQLHGKIVMIKDSRDVIGMALKALGYSANSVDKQELQAAKQLLLQQKSYVHSYSYVALNETSVLNTGKGIAAMAYSGDGLMLQDVNPEISYVVPEEGCALWVDYLTVLNTSKNRHLAFKFINFLNETNNAKQLAEYVHYATPNRAAEKLLPKEFLNNPTIYPNKDTLSRCEFYKPLPAKAIKRRNSIFTRVIQ